MYRGGGDQTLSNESEFFVAVKLPWFLFVKVRMKLMGEIHRFSVVSSHASPGIGKGVSLSLDLLPIIS
jgi:hypothetical protein